MTDQSLFPARPARQCVVCHCEVSTGRKKRDSAEPVFLAITPVMYRRGTGKGQLRNAAKVNICESCLAKACSNGRLGWFQGKSPLWVALRASLADCLTTLAENDAFDEVKRPDWKNPAQETLL